MGIVVGDDTYVVGRAQGSVLSVYPDKALFPRWRHTFRRQNNESDGRLQKRVLEALPVLKKKRQAHAPPTPLYTH